MYRFSCLLLDLHCTRPDIIPNAQYDVSSLAPGGTVTYTCDPTYTHMYGDLVRLCNGGVWGGILPTCSSMYSVGFFLYWTLLLPCPSFSYFVYENVGMHVIFPWQHNLLFSFNVCWKHSRHIMPSKFYLIWNSRAIWIQNIIKTMMFLSLPIVCKLYFWVASSMFLFCFCIILSMCIL